MAIIGKLAPERQVELFVVMNYRKERTFNLRRKIIDGFEVLTLANFV